MIWIRLLLTLIVVHTGTLWTNADDGVPVHRESFHLYLLIGQSNMAGRGVVEPQDEMPHARVMMLTKAGQWVPATDPLHFDKTVAGVGLGRTFGLQMAAADSDVTIGLIPCAVGGSPIDVWRPGEYYEPTKSHPWDDAVQRTHLALQSGVLKGVLWHQGESDATEHLSESYADKLDDLVKRIRQEFESPELPFVAGQLGNFEERPWKSFHVTVDQALRQLPDRMPFTACVSSEGLTHKGDAVHFDSTSYRELGRRYAVALQQLTSQQSGLQR